MSMARPEPDRQLAGWFSEGPPTTSRSGRGRSGSVVGAVHPAHRFATVTRAAADFRITATWPAEGCLAGG
jgi:hypothetical protein